MANLRDQLVSSIGRGDANGLAATVQEIYKLHYPVSYKTKAVADINRASRRLVSDIWAHNIPTSLDLGDYPERNLHIWVSPHPDPSRAGGIAAVSVHIPRTSFGPEDPEQLMKHLGVGEHRWTPVPAESLQHYILYRFRRFVAELGPDNQTFYNQPDRGRRVAVDYVDRRYEVQDKSLLGEVRRFGRLLVHRDNWNHHMGVWDYEEAAYPPEKDKDYGAPINKQQYIALYENLRLAHPIPRSRRHIRYRGLFLGSDYWQSK